MACPDGRVDFYALAPRMMHTGRMARWAASSQVPVTFVAFDLLHLDGQDLTGLPLVERKRLLDELHLVGPAWATNGWYPGDGDTLFQRVRRAWARRRGGEAAGRPLPSRQATRLGSRERARPGRGTTPLAADHGYRRNRRNLL